MPRGRPSKSPKKASPKKTATKGKRAKKDPDAPKRGMSAYMLWLQEMRPTLTKPGMGVADVAKAAGVAWAKVGDKTKWEKAAAKDKERYTKEMAAYKKKAAK